MVFLDSHCGTTVRQIRPYGAVHRLVGWWNLIVQEPGLAKEHQTQGKRKTDIKSTSQTCTVIGKSKDQKQDEQ